MKLHLLLPALAALLTLTFAGTPAQAQTSAPATAAATSTKAAKTNYGGTITALDASAGTFTVKSKKHTLSLRVSSSTKFKGATALSGFAVGDKINGSYTKDAAGALTAASVYKKGAAAKK